MKKSTVAYKIFGTCAVLCVVLTILGWVTGKEGIWILDVAIGIIGGIALIAGIIGSIWDI